MGATRVLLRNQRSLTLGYRAAHTTKEVLAAPNLAVMYMKNGWRLLSSRTEERQLEEGRWRVDLSAAGGGIQSSIFNNINVRSSTPGLLLQLLLSNVCFQRIKQAM